MNEKHPVWFVLPALLVVAGGFGFWSAAGGSFQDPLFWKAASLLLFLAIVGLTIELRRNAGRLYSRIKRQTNS